MKAVIMAGGEGSRLRPLTCACPKPMVPVLDRPVMAYTLDLLRRHGVSQAAVTLMYLAGQVSGYFGDGAEYGVNLTYFTEQTPLGTAGSVGQAAHMLDETTVVLSGDGLTNCDLTAALRFHRDRGALATLVLKKVKSPLEYGVVLTDGQGRGAALCGKAGLGRGVFRRGQYRHLPAGAPGHRHDPRRPALGFRAGDVSPHGGGRTAVYGWLMEGYWCDIGDTAAYLRAHVDLLDGRMGAAARYTPRRGQPCPRRGDRQERGAGSALLRGAGSSGGGGSADRPLFGAGGGQPGGARGQRQALGTDAGRSGRGPLPAQGRGAPVRRPGGAGLQRL